MILKGEHLFITGGSAGIGEALVLGGVKEGAKVSFVDIDDAKPGRKDMPQTDADKTAPIDKLNALAKGYINVAAPFVKDGYKATGNMLKEHFQRIARIKSKK